MAVFDKIDKEKHPQLYKRTEQLLKSREQLSKSKEAEESLKVRAEKAERQLKQAIAAAKGEKTPKKPKGEKTPKNKGFDYAQLAFLEGRGIKHSDDQDYLFKEMETTGKELKEVIEFEYVQEHLKKEAEARASADAVPAGNKRGSDAGKDKVDYWVAKGELPPNTPENQQLRRDIVNARKKRETDSSKFTDQPVIQ